ncbi:MAG: hypothetical protein VYD28_08150, partial [SAR324 cluster bacterium]|nr:hypothetical protein [SAR324 cluster bacterium]
HALMILSTSLSLSDSRLYEAAEVLKTSRLRAFLTITIPGARYGIISTSFRQFDLRTDRDNFCFCILDVPSRLDDPEHIFITLRFPSL